MSSKALDPNLASILESIRATIGSGEVSAVAPEAVAAAEEEGSPAARSRESVRAARAAFAKSRTVEEFLADLARPYVQTWLADHLPEMVQKMVAEEISRLTSKG